MRSIPTGPMPSGGISRGTSECNSCTKSLSRFARNCGCCAAVERLAGSPPAGGGLASRETRGLHPWEPVNARRLVRRAACYAFLLVCACQCSVSVRLSCSRVCLGSEKESLPYGLRRRATNAGFGRSLSRLRRPDGLLCLTLYYSSRSGFGRMSWPFGLQSFTVGSQPLGDEAASCMFVHGALSVPLCMHEDGAMSVPHRRLRGCAVVFCCGAADHAPCQCGASASMPLLA